MSLAAVAGGIGAAGQAVGAIGEFQGRRARAKSLLADAEAKNRAGVAESADRLREGRAVEAEGAARAGASGFTLEGSPLAVLGQIARDASTSAARARFEASREGTRLRNEARQEKAAAKFGLISGLAGAASTGIGAFTKGGSADG